MSTKATLRYSPNPNPLQKEHLAERYIRFGRPGEGLAWLEGDRGGHEDRRDRLLAEAYAALGDTVRLRSVRRALFKRTGSPDEFEAWHGILDPAERAGTVADARDAEHRRSDHGRAAPPRAEG
ncbi:MAG TPA: hypothetical protein VF814_19280 [Casimicrobiaceae bacterium]